MEQDADKITQTPYPTTSDGTAYAITTRYGMMAARNASGGGEFPMTAVICEGAPKPRQERIEYHVQSDGTIRGTDSASGIPCAEEQYYRPENPAPAIVARQPTRIIVGESMVIIHPDKNYGKAEPRGDASPALLATTGKSPHLVVEASPRQEGMRFAEMPNGNIRAYDGRRADRAGIFEMQITSPSNPSPAVTAANAPKVLEPGFRIRKLTPRECFRLMDVNDADIDKIQSAGISKSAQYKLAGNSIVVACLHGIFKGLFLGEVPDNEQISLF